MEKERVVLITGASSGIGLACAKMLADKGYIVYGTSRKASYPPTTVKKNFYMIQMDVTDEGSIKRAVNFIIEKEGKIDILINNAGFGLAGSVEDTSMKEAFEQFDTNFFGVHRVIKEVLPFMRERRKGYIINVSSIGGIIGLPFQPFYSASKFAVEGLTEALWHELKPFGIKVILIEPGDLKTEFTQRRVFVEKSQKSPYYVQMQKTISIAQRDETHGSSPEKVGKLLLKLLRKKNPKLRYQVGPSYEKVAVLLKRILPEKIFLWAISKYYKIG